LNRLVTALLLQASTGLYAQTFLIAEAEPDAYAQIQKALDAPAETPDCSHPDFGPHITLETDSVLEKPVFVFHSHVTPDNDRCSAFDRQRIEIKTYGPSPAYVKGFLGDSVTLRWRFQLPEGFQSSKNFTHIHQIKAGDGDDGSPLITLTPRKGNPDVLQLIHTAGTGAVSSGTVAHVNLEPFLGVWVEAYEKITYGYKGRYSIVIKRLSDGEKLFEYSNDELDLWRKDTTFIRPKWGVYRSLNDAGSLRDERVKFDRFCIAKGDDDCPAETTAAAVPAP
jgi:hypothetical protein